MKIGDGVIVACVIAIVTRSAIRAAAAGDAAIDLLPREIALGPIPEGEEREVRLTVSNGGAHPAEIAVVPSCTCMTPDKGPLSVAPFSNATFVVRVSTARKPGYNVAHVQLAGPGGAILAQSRISFTGVRGYVFDPPVLFLQGGDARAAARAFCLTRSVPQGLHAVADDPALAVTAQSVGPRVWEIAVALTGRPRNSLAAVRIVESGAAGVPNARAARVGVGAGEQTVGVLTVSVPATRIGEVRLSPVAEALDGGRARAWMLFDTEARCDMRVLAVHGVSGEGPGWRVDGATTATGSHLWIELSYPAAAALGAIEVDLAVGQVQERVRALLPGVAGT